MTFAAIAGGPQVLFLSGAKICRQTNHGPDEVGDGSECRRGELRRSASKPQSLSNDVGLRDLASARFRFDVCDEWLRQAYSQRLHRRIVLHTCQLCKTLP